MSIERGRRFLPDGSFGVATVVREVESLVRGAAFWVAALLPLSYVPLLHTVSISFAGFTKLLLVNVVALFVGHSYGAQKDEEDTDDVDEAGAEDDADARAEATVEVRAESD